ncbi:hypothetical protein ACS0TY_025768 [Phlomoides rotata]
MSSLPPKRIVDGIGITELGTLFLTKHFKISVDIEQASVEADLLTSHRAIKPFLHLSIDL